MQPIFIFNLSRDPAATLHLTYMAQVPLPWTRAELCANHLDAEKMQSQFLPRLFSHIGLRPASQLTGLLSWAHSHIADKADPTFHIYSNSVVSKGIRMEENKPGGPSPRQAWTNPSLI